MEHLHLFESRLGCGLGPRAGIFSLIESHVGRLGDVLFEYLLGVMSHWQTERSIFNHAFLTSASLTHLRVLSTQSLVPQTLHPRPITHLIRPVIIASTHRSSTAMDFSSEGLVMGRHSVHLWEEPGLARDRRMLFVQCHEQTLTVPM
jgi:hypothetical protein